MNHIIRPKIIEVKKITIENLQKQLTIGLHENGTQFDISSIISEEMDQFAGGINISSNNLLRPEYVSKRGEQIRISKSGYLRKQSSSLKRDWKRRYFVLSHGQLFYIRSADDLSPIHVVNVLLCSVRQSSKTLGLDFCFDIISPSKRVYTLQAESENETLDWIKTLNKCCESMLSATNALSEEEKNMTKTILIQHLNEKESNFLKLRLMNQECADCSDKNPEWASINLGIQICIQCAGQHRQLGSVKIQIG